MPAHGNIPDAKLNKITPGSGVLAGTLRIDYERLPETVAGLPFVAFACLMLQRLVNVVAHSP